MSGGPTSDAKAPALTHIDDAGNPRMVDVSGKPDTDRVAVAEGWVRLSAAALSAITEGRVRKGDVLLIAQLAGIQAAAKAADSSRSPPPADGAGVVEAQRGYPRPGDRPHPLADGVEMEALTAVTGACLTVYDMVKAIDRGMRIEGIRLLEKHGGRSGSCRRGPTRRSGTRRTPSDGVALADQPSGPSPYRRILCTASSDRGRGSRLRGSCSPRRRPGPAGCSGTRWSPWRRARRDRRRRSAVGSSRPTGPGGQIAAPDLGTPGEGHGPLDHPPAPGRCRASGRPAGSGHQPRCHGRAARPSGHPAEQVGEDQDVAAAVQQRGHLDVSTASR